MPHFYSKFIFNVLDMLGAHLQRGLPCWQTLQGRFAFSFSWVALAPYSVPQVLGWTFFHGKGTKVLMIGLKSRWRTEEVSQ